MTTVGYLGSIDELLALRESNRSKCKTARWVSDEEAQILYDECKALEPELIVECGTANGWSILWLAAAAPEARIVTFDPVERLRVYEAASVEYRIEDFDEAVADVLKGNEDVRKLIFIDGKHHHSAVKKNWDAITPFIKKGDLVIFHDSKVNRGVRRHLHENIADLEKRTYRTKRGITVVVI